MLSIDLEFNDTDVKIKVPHHATFDEIFANINVPESLSGDNNSKQQDTNELFSHLGYKIDSSCTTDPSKW